VQSTGCAFQQKGGEVGRAVPEVVRALHVIIEATLMEKHYVTGSPERYQ
jgi:hypothetical protein